jgi:rhodanese-related sulfurtransferase
MKRSLSCAALNTLLADRADAAVLDVRRRPAFLAGPRLIPGAVWKEPEEVAICRRAEPEPACRRLLRAGHEVSRSVVERLRAQGFEAAWLEGGIEAWRASGGPLTVASGGTKP